MEVSRERLIELYRQMLRIRRAEEKVLELCRAGLPGMFHLTTGMEAVAVGICGNLKSDDYILSTHRGKGHYIAKGGDLKALFAELMAKKDGSNHGKGGPVHIIDPSVGMLGANGIVGSSLPIATGVALSARMRKSRQVAVCFLGDGAANSGPCHESMNLASVWKLPVIFAIENNLYQVSTPVSRHSSIQDFAVRARGYDMPGYRVDGMDVVAVYNATGKAVQRARAGEGPSLLEFKTYRFRGHAEADTTCGRGYRSEEEMQYWEAKDPLRTVRAYIIERKWMVEDDFGAMEESLGGEISEAVSFAEASPSVPREWALTDVFTG